MTERGDGLDWSQAAWRKSSRSACNGNCVEFAALGAFVAFRDTKDRDGGIIVVPLSTWGALASRIKEGEL